MTARPQDAPVLEIRGICKTFPGVRALDEVSFNVGKGEVHAIVGENGAGKSTLMKVLAGLHAPDGGKLVYNGQEQSFTSPLDARLKGILLVHQELSLSPELSVAENIYLGAWPTNRVGVLRKKKLHEDARAALQALGSDINPMTRVGELSIARQQMVEIARAQAFNANVVIFDEPTASLADTEKAQLFKTILELKERGRSILYISHKMDEIFAITDRITVLRDGKYQGTETTAETDIDKITRMMIGRDLDAYFHRAKSAPGAEVLRVEKMCSSDFSDVSLSVHAGEVLGLYGLIGAGRSEVAESLFGMRQIRSGTLYWHGEETPFPKPRQAIEMGISLVPESRKEQGLVLGMNGRENTTLPHLSAYAQAGVMVHSREMQTYREYVDLLDIRTSGPDQLVATLSGGNQQKFVLAKWLCGHPKLIILDEPTRGIDIGSKSAIHKFIAGLAEQGLAVIVISSEMPEILGVSHRVAVMSEGKIVAEFTGADQTEENLIAAVSERRNVEAPEEGSAERPPVDARAVMGGQG
ncbi:sugar ABC transporter ATP-binding protein [Pseudohoeflea coraliihabitans]|uniref:Sugar ABC transporter ATP-binding protein n=1 Tax=Pseudohoeflea coraliihabitans TaxID=2860393 RepID=A0ABS6WTS9_9HYPH|nr:sugar ABC transporter ATP-binding protein [Pseudohoeflea sp. DP4N28-3]MBW3099033.1 sugar ABC transporter ATP-binding protein [Pseudohoeflea sp. DP4N28-3]